MKGVFDTKPNSHYDDDIAVRYHFPTRYLATAQSLVGDWVLYREPRRNGGRQGYVAVAQVTKIELDAIVPGHAYAYVTAFEFFQETVPLSRNGRYAEEGLRNLTDASAAGRALQGRSIRTISEQDFAHIVRDGLSQVLDVANVRRFNLDDVDLATLGLLQATPAEQERTIEQILLNRKIRDARFRGVVCDAYDNTCAVTGLKIINGGGRAEVQAAHIKPVSAGGPDIVQNGVALSATVHWLFDRHLISIADDYTLLVAHNRVPAELRSLFGQQGNRIKLPQDEACHPRRDFLAYHRTAFAA